MVRRRVLRLAAALATALAARFGAGAADAPTEWEVKAAYLFNFTRFVEWPEGDAASAHAPFVVGIFGPDPFGRVLDETLAGRTVGGRPIVVRRLERPEEADSVQILFVSARGEREVARALRAAQGRPVLTVGDADVVGGKGVILTFRILDSRVRFAVNLAPAAEARLRISSQLLKVALSVEGR